MEPRGREVDDEPFAGWLDRLAFFVGEPTAVSGVCIDPAVRLLEFTSDTLAYVQQLIVLVVERRLVRTSARLISVRNMDDKRVRGGFYFFEGEK